MEFLTRNRSLLLVCVYLNINWKSVFVGDYKLTVLYYRKNFMNPYDGR